MSEFSDFFAQVRGAHREREFDAADEAVARRSPDYRPSFEERMSEWASSARRGYDQFSSALGMARSGIRAEVGRTPERAREGLLEPALTVGQAVGGAPGAVADEFIQKAADAAYWYQENTAPGQIMFPRGPDGEGPIRPREERGHFVPQVPLRNPEGLPDHLIRGIAQFTTLYAPALGLFRLTGGAPFASSMWAGAFADAFAFENKQGTLADVLIHLGLDHAFLDALSGEQAANEFEASLRAMVEGGMIGITTEALGFIPGLRFLRAGLRQNPELIAQFAEHLAKRRRISLGDGVEADLAPRDMQAPEFNRGRLEAIRENIGNTELVAPGTPRAMRGAVGGGGERPPPPDEAFGRPQREQGETPEELSERALREAEEGAALDAPDEHTLVFPERGDSAPPPTGRVSREERELLGGDQELTGAVRAAREAFPRSQGWARVEVAGVRTDPKTGARSVQFKAIPYGFHKGRDGKALKGKARERRVDHLARKMVDEYRDIEARAAAGDHNANVIMRQAGWYRNMRERLRDEFGGNADIVADLLGAASPNTPVRTNWNFAMNAIRRFVRGDFDDQLDQLAQHLAAGRPIGEFQNPILQESGKLYGINSRNLMLAMLDEWRIKNPGQAPKARNFSGNLIGYEDQATIDVWAARTLRRLAGMDRIPLVAEQGVGGALKQNLIAGGEFGFGQDVYARAARELGVAPDDLQASMWFAEKELWGRNRWTSKQGEGGSFEQMLDAEGIGRYMSGLSIQTADVIPTDAAMAAVTRSFDSVLKPDKDVISYKALPTLGRYAGADERAFDIEVTASRDWDPTPLVRQTIKTAKDNDQYDAFVSRVLGPGDDPANARPGIEIYLTYKKDISELNQIIDEIVSMGVDGFTFAIDYRQAARKGAGAVPDKTVGVRVQYVPEIAMRWDDELRAAAKADPRAVDEAVQQMKGVMESVVRSVSGREGVSMAKMYDYDTIVIGRENYDEYLRAADQPAEVPGAAGAGSGEGRGVPWFGGSRSAHVQAAIERLERGTGGGGADVAGGGQRGAGEGIEPPRTEPFPPEGGG